MKMNIQIGDKSFTAKLENNPTADELLDILKEKPLSVKMKKYGGFEQVVSLGFILREDDQPLTAVPGDIVLYNSSQIVMFYGSNSWSYTKLAKIEDLAGWKEALANNSITAVLSVK